MTTGTGKVIPASDAGRSLLIWWYQFEYRTSITSCPDWIAELSVVLFYVYIVSLHPYVVFIVNVSLGIFKLTTQLKIRFYPVHFKTFFYELNYLTLFWQHPTCMSECYFLRWVWLFANPWTVAGLSSVLCPWDSPGQNTGVGCHFLLQGIFLTQELNLGVPHHRQILYHRSHRESSTT